MILIVFNA